MTGTSGDVDMQVPDFLAFYEGRPNEERWELVGGMPIMLAPPFTAHQRAASNIERALNEALETLGLDRRADREIGLQIENFPNDRPEPEVSIIDAACQHERSAAGARIANAAKRSMTSSTSIGRIRSRNSSS